MCTKNPTKTKDYSESDSDNADPPGGKYGPPGRTQAMFRGGTPAT